MNQDYKNKYLKYKKKYLKLKKKLHGGSSDEIDIEDEIAGTEQYLNDLQKDYDELKEKHINLETDCDYLKLVYGRSQNAYNDLLINYNNLLINYNNCINRLGEQIGSDVAQVAG
jgi:chromosome segregation ATPase